MKKLYSDSILLCLVWYVVFIQTALTATAQLATSAQKVFGGSGFDELPSLEQTKDGGYILGGYSGSGISGNKTENSRGMDDYWVIKLNRKGDIAWQKTIGGGSTDLLNSVQQTKDGGYILGGTSSSDISGDKTENSRGLNDFWIVKLNANGNIKWQKTIGGSSADNFGTIRQTADGGYILGGTSYSNASGDKTENSIGQDDYWVLKLDANGNILWQNTIGGWYVDYLNVIIQTKDGEYVIAGSSSSDISGDKTENNIGIGQAVDYWVVKLDSIGNIKWQNTIGGSGSDDLKSIYQTNDGGYILGGSSYSDISGDKTENSLGSADYWIIKIDSIGNILWQNTIGGNDEEALSSIQQTTDSGYIVGGTSYSNISGDKTENSLGFTDYWIMKLKPNGNIQWQNTIGGNNFEIYGVAQQTSNGGYIVGGGSRSGISGDKTEASFGLTDYWVLALKPNGQISNLSPQVAFNDTEEKTIEHISEEGKASLKKPFTVYPNPAKDFLYIQCEEETMVQVSDIQGRILFTKTISSKQVLNISSLPNGIYNITDVLNSILVKIIKE